MSSLGLATALPGQRRSARRARAKARLRLHLHLKGHCILGIPELQRIKNILNHHHSRDPAIIRRIASEMASLKAPAWKCADCRRMVKGNDAYCPACGQFWQDCMDSDYQTASTNAQQRHATPTRHTSYRGQGQEDASWQWNNRRPSQSPRQRQRPKSRRQHGQDGGQAHHVGQGKGKPKGSGKNPPNAKGKGGKNPHQLGKEGMAPLPPPPLPAQVSFSDPTWTQLNTPFPATGAPNLEMVVPPSLAETKLQKVLGVLRKNETELPPEVAEVVKETKMTDGLNKIQNMHDAIENLGEAQQAFEKACFARTQNLASWRQFLHLSVQRWQEYTQHFLSQEKHNLEQIAQARDSVKQAQTIFKELQEKGVITIDSEGDPAMMEEEPAATKTESAQRIQDGLVHLTQSLDQLANQADLEFAAEQQQKKRARKEEPALEGAAPSDSSATPLPSMQPFGVAHR